MKKRYPWLWFDVDGTLFDYNAAEAVALQNTFQSLQLPFEDGYLNVYRKINHQLWQALEKQEITPAALRFRRFELLLEALQLSASYEEMSSTYVEQLANCAKLMDAPKMFWSRCIRTVELRLSPMGCKLFSAVVSPLHHQRAYYRHHYLGGDR